MTRYVMFEAFHGGRFWRKLVCRVFMHLWKNVVDAEIGHSGNNVVSIRVDRCVECGINQLWILTETKLSEFVHKGEKMK